MQCSPRCVGFEVPTTAVHGTRRLVCPRATHARVRACTGLRKRSSRSRDKKNLLLENVTSVFWSFEEFNYSSLIFSYPPSHRTPNAGALKKILSLFNTALTF